MIVVPHGDRLKFRVSSRTGQEPYIVDVGSYLRHGVCLGRCDCKDFMINQLKEVRKLVNAERAGGKKFIPKDEFRCAHIIAARRRHDRECGDAVIISVRAKYPDYGTEEEEL